MNEWPNSSQRSIQAPAAPGAQGPVRTQLYSQSLAGFGTQGLTPTSTPAALFSSPEFQKVQFALLILSISLDSVLKYVTAWAEPASCAPKAQCLDGGGTRDRTPQAPLQLFVPVPSSGQSDKQTCEVAASGICLKMKGTPLDSPSCWLE